MKMNLFSVLMACCFAVATPVQAQKLKRGCQRVPVTYEDSSTRTGDIKGSASGVIVKGEIKGSYSAYHKKTYTVQEVICSKPTNQTSRKK